MFLAILRNIISFVLYFSGLLAIVRQRQGQAVRILAYHRLTADGRTDLNSDLVSCSRDEFKKQLRYLKKHHTVISLEDFAQRLRLGRSWRRGTVVITFDDGYKETATLAYPLLRQFDLPATVFVPVDYIGGGPFWWDEAAYWLRRIKENAGSCSNRGEGSIASGSARSLIQELKQLSENDRRRTIQKLKEQCFSNLAGPPRKDLVLDWNDLKILALGGVDIGSHGLSHNLFNQLDSVQLSAEIFESKKQLETNMNIPIKSFSFPEGGIDSIPVAALHLLSEAGYNCACTIIPGDNTPQTDPLLLKRICIRGDPIWVFAAKVSGLDSWLGSLLHFFNIHQAPGRTNGGSPS